jgi:uncharacterized protein involved in exopolysaccharide biosynthesis
MAIRERAQKSVRDVLTVVFRHKWRIGIVWILVVTAVGGLVYFADDVYESQAKLLIRMGRENVSLDPSVSGPIVGMQQSRESEVKSELAILKSGYLADRVVDVIGPEVVLGSGGPCASDDVSGAGQQSKIAGTDNGERAGALRQMAAAQILAGLDVVAEKGTNIINVTYDSHSADAARDILQALIGAYLERHIELYSGQASPEFFEKQTEELERELNTREERLAAFRSEHGIGDLEGQMNVLLREISELYLARYVGELVNSPALAPASKARVEALADATRKDVKTVELSRTTGVTNYAADAIKERVTDLRLREADLAVRYSDDYRPLVDLRQQIARLESSLAQEEETHTTVTTGLNTTHQTLELALAQEQANLQGHLARQDALAEELGRKEEEYARFAAFKLEFDRLKREVEVADSEYRQYQENLHRARVSNALDIDRVSNVSVVQPATLPPGPAGPNRRMIIALSIVLGLCVGLGVAFFINQIDDSLKTTDDIERRLGLPVLAVVSMREFRQCI